MLINRAQIGGCRVETHRKSKNMPSATMLLHTHSSRILPLQIELFMPLWKCALGADLILRFKKIGNADAFFEEEGNSVITLLVA